MSQREWDDAETYMDAHLLGHDPVLEACLEATSAAGLPPIGVAPSQGKLLHLLARLKHASRILEIGALGGYSTTWLARALPPDGKLVSLELEARHAAVARANLERAGLSQLTEIRVGPAIDALPKLAEERDLLPFDLVFIDADKPSNADYFAWARRLTVPGSLIIVDNVVRQGRVADATSTAEEIVGTRRLIEAVGADTGVSATAIQTVGSKGHDGMLIALVEEA